MKLELGEPAPVAGPPYRAANSWATQSSQKLQQELNRSVFHRLRMLVDAQWRLVFQ